MGEHQLDVAISKKQKCHVDCAYITSGHILGRYLLSPVAKALRSLRYRRYIDRGVHCLWTARLPQRSRCVELDAQRISLSYQLDDDSGRSVATSDAVFPGQIKPLAPFKRLLQGRNRRVK